MKENSKLVYLYLFLTFFFWGSLYVVSKYVLGKIPPFTLSFLRFVIAVAFLSVLVHMKNYPSISRKDYKHILFIGFFGYFVALMTQLIGTKLSNASLAALVNSVNPIVIMVMAAIFLKERLTGRKIAGMLISLTGIYIILRGGHSGDTIAGIVISLISVFIWSFVSVCIRKVSHDYPPILIAAYGMFVAMLFSFPCAAIELINTESIAWDWTVLPCVLYMGIICTGVAHLLWNKSLSLIEAGTCSAFYPVQPLSAVVLGILFLHESVTISFWIGALLIVGGVMICLLNRA